MKKILITMTLLILSMNACFAQDLLNNVFNAVQAINYGVSPSAVVQDYAYDYAQQKINNAQQTQNQNNYYQPTQYQTNTQYPTQQVNPYQNVNADTSTNQYSAPAQNPYVENMPSYNGDFVIKPFGTFTYYDGLMDVINKLRAMQGVTEIYLDYYGLLSCTEIKTVNLKKIPQEKLSSVINAYLIKQTADMKNYPFVGKDGTKHYSYGGLATVEAKTVMIENTPFDLSIRFLVNDGMTIQAPSKVFRDTRGRYYPLFIKEIYLKSYSPLTKDNWQKINQAHRSKFASILNNLSETDSYEVKEQNWRIHHKYSNIFSFSYDEYNSKCELSYSSDNYQNYLDEFYKEHLKKIDAQKYKSVPNSKI